MKRLIPFLLLAGLLAGCGGSSSGSGGSTTIAAVNPIYASIRDAEWARMQSIGSLTPDPRILANLDRVRSIPGKGRFILVDSGSQRMFMYENGVPVDSMKVVVGMPTMPTPSGRARRRTCTKRRCPNLPSAIPRRTGARGSSVAGRRA